MEPKIKALLQTIRASLLADMRTLAESQLASDPSEGIAQVIANKKALIEMIDQVEVP